MTSTVAVIVLVDVLMMTGGSGCCSGCDEILPARWPLLWLLRLNESASVSVNVTLLLLSRRPDWQQWWCDENCAWRSSSSLMNC
jgi:hypothetical protein